MGAGERAWRRPSVPSLLPGGRGTLPPRQGHGSSLCAWPARLRRPVGFPTGSIYLNRLSLRICRQVESSRHLGGRWVRAACPPQRPRAHKWWDLDPPEAQFLQKESRGGPHTFPGASLSPRSSPRGHGMQQPGRLLSRFVLGFQVILRTAGRSEERSFPNTSLRRDQCVLTMRMNSPL